MANIQLVHFRQFSNRLHIVVSQTVAGIDFQAEAGGESRGFADARQLSLARETFGRFGIGTGVNFDISRERRARRRR